MLVILLSLAGCAGSPPTLHVPDTEMCVTLPNYRAFCAYSLSDNERFIEKDEWYAMQPGRFSLSSGDLALIQSFIDEACIRANCEKKVLVFAEKLREMRKLSE